ncbi:MAG: aspartate-semialdehyde dehydrogenase [Bacteroidetes bacterium]|uniref:Aspartate-semialdehyde dehydrogenase n=1 Tax=Phaeocystidibacter marisrubri TaxID=1577780 RepID=A0A6L3ZCT1_9FLAO|nr:aspartate-semialdehyde dehydrogenase [Phaeocystidibacter marisrubri]KAB2815129.1 aspartate-semialdehyde dehydrogenase [Phaeocystidibacter marisrubri]TNE28471.1 MAG: aspartate-semialdehyde dehydrogenase [Bacteroidota bacterium]GGH70467.1 aspartate-semialdehyde dehydrogenase [Phaeocystidibacter marisrubri]
MRVAVVGATGMVGEVMLKVLEERNFPVTELIPAASVRSVGKKVMFKGKEVSVVSLPDAVAAKPDIALFSAGGDVSTAWAPKFAEVGTRVIDNSSAWRMTEGIPLVVPEINGSIISEDDRIIANPNCSTIQLVMVLNPLHERYGITRVIVSTYQSITGTGVKAVEQLQNEREGKTGPMAYPYPIDKNCLPQCDVFTDNGYTKEEMKLTRETVKILDDDSVLVSATAVRVPVQGGHSESVNIEFAEVPSVPEIRTILNATPGITLQDNPDINLYPMPRFAEGKDDTFVGRIRVDYSNPRAVNCWIVADNLRKGAATNAVQIAEYILAQGW